MLDEGEIGFAQDDEAAGAELEALRAVELRTAAFYEAAAAASRDLGAIRLLGCLADFEREHHEALCRSTRSPPARRGRGPAAFRSRPLPGDLRISRRGLVGAEPLLATLEEATKLERAAHAAYEGAAGRVRKAGSRRFFLALAEEEWRHRLILLDLAWHLRTQGHWEGGRG